MHDKLKVLWIQLTGDKRRLSILGVTLLVGLLLWARLIVVSNIPRTAVANTPAPAQAKSDRPAETEVVRPVENLTARLVSVPDHDPFVISPVYFPKSNPDGQMLIEPTKSSLDMAEEAKAAEARRTQQLTALVQSLKLEAVMTGRSMALINGKVYRLSDPVTVKLDPSVSFILSIVEQRSVTLTCEGRTFELKISTPGE
ncbi:MAG TPA: hypothetical protein VG711_11785 [Phycisphaerales bacterium]|nr:hypothetical protein [Phycisphaerales bacterium]